MSDTEQVLDGSAEVVAEPMIPQSQVNDLVRAQKEKAYQKGVESREGVQLTPDQVQQLLKDERESWNKDLEQKRQQEQQLRDAETQKEQLKANQKYADDVIKSVYSKIEVAKADIPDFDEAVNKVSIFNQYPMLLVYADQVENTAEVLYELAKHPHKVKKVLDAGENGLVEIGNLAGSIKTNKTAKSQKYADQPVKHIKSSTTAVSNGDLGSMSAADLAAYFR